MNSALPWIASLFGKVGADYWVDSGSLLGLIREGQLIEGDNDIDISTWDGVQDTILRELESEDDSYDSIAVYRYRSFKFKIKIMQGGDRDIDINFFRKTGMYAWCPQPICPPSNGQHGSEASIAVKLFRGIISMSDMITGFRNTPLRSWHMWWLPLSFIETPVLDPDLHIRVPAQVHDYLEYRYGDWRKPRSDWLITMDGGLRMLDRSFYEKS